MARIEKLVQVIDSGTCAAFGAKADFIALRMLLLALVVHNKQIFISSIVRNYRSASRGPPYALHWHGEPAQHPEKAFGLP